MTFKSQPTIGGDISVMTRVIVRAQKKRDFRGHELQDVNKELDDMLAMLIRRTTMDKDELRPVSTTLSVSSWRLLRRKD